ncbi:MAG TPA: hypothetical protein VEW28_03105 [Candidatus Kapabacteria bacterium]|nr:hypothetical protein [Candidatus Kapabacteria bacterium]
MKYIFAVIVTFFSAAAFAGPIFPSRVLVIAPQFREASDTTKGAAFLQQQGIWGDLFHAFNSTGDRFFWSISTGGIIQFVEWEHSGIYLVGDYEMTADQHSNISFHPRGIFWTEGVIYMDKIGETELHAGYINRCHHDIDNLEHQTIGNAEERTLIYSSIVERAIWRNVELAGIHSVLWTQADEYVFRQDYLIPDTLVQAPTDETHLIASFSGGGKFDLACSESAHTYLRASFTESAYRSFRTFTFDARAEFGVEFLGLGSSMDIYLGGETLHDDGTRPMPVNSNFVYLGLRFLGNNIAL